MLRAVALLVIAAGVAGWFLTAPRPLPADFLSGVTPDAAHGAQVFAAAGCAGCHMAPGSQDRSVLAGGRSFATAFGTFLAPNISPDPDQGIGNWTDLEIANAVMRGVGREGEHLYPALPYTTYRAMTAQDMADLVAHLRTLPADASPSAPHQVGFPFNIRRALGGWKLLFMPGPDDWVLETPATPEVERGRYLVEALGHCGECHTPRNLLGGMDRGRWLSGGPNPDGEGRIPNITPAVLHWEASSIAAYLQSGFTPDFDSAGGSMVDVIASISQLPDADRLAIAAYLQAVPPVEPAP